MLESSTSRSSIGKGARAQTGLERAADIEPNITSGKYKLNLVHMYDFTSHYATFVDYFE